MNPIIKKKIAIEDNDITTLLKTYQAMKYVITKGQLQIINCFLFAAIQYISHFTLNILLYH